MSCNPVRWLWGLLPLAALAWVALMAMPPRIEADLKARSEAALAQRGLSWAKSAFSGRDGVVNGRAMEDAEQRQAANVVSGVWGVRTVDDKTEVVELVKPYTWAAAVADKAVTITGHVPTEAARKVVLDAAKAAFPDRTIDDKMKLARGAPATDVWQGATGFALKQLAHLKPGAKAELDGAALTISGEATSADAYKTVMAALSDQIPKGGSLKARSIGAPVIKPYVWSASLRGQELVINGYAPSERVRSEIVQAARKAMPKVTVSDHMVLGAGEPGDWHKVVNTALASLGHLTEGSAEMRDASLNVVGMVEQAATVETVRRALKADVPGSYKVNEEIRQDPRVAALEEAARRQKAEEEARRAAEEEARKRAAAASSDAASRAAAEEDARRRAADETARRAAAEADAKRQADEAARKAAEEASRRAAEEATRRAAEEAAKRAAAEAEQRRVAAAAAVTEQARALAARCQDELRTAAREGGIHFQRASAEIERASHNTLDKLALIAKSCPDAVIEVAGHTDAEGEPGRNQRLSERRARSVADYLQRAGVPESRIVAVGYGDTKPIAPNDTAEDRAKNRRIEFNVVAR